ncbi:MAG: hypothetical protein ACJAQ4_002325 [Cryomorphaceae bacterium]|jgi:hypothetical protein
MNRLFLCIIASVLAVSTICNCVNFQLDGKLNFVLADLACESESEIEAIDIRLFATQSVEKNRMVESNDVALMPYSEGLAFDSFLEVPIPPPKG